MATWKGNSASASERETLVETSCFRGTIHTDLGGNATSLMYRGGGGTGSGYSHCQAGFLIKQVCEIFCKLSRKMKGAEARGEEGGHALTGALVPGWLQRQSSARRLFSVICAELMIQLKRELQCYTNPEIRRKISRCKHLKFLQ